jgi:hypothetical protein
LVKELFECREFLEWQTGNPKLGLFLDALDETRLLVPNVGAIPADRLSRCPLGRLFLRIACRTADWPRTLDEALIAIFSKDAVRRVLLAPLQRKDAVMAAELEGVNQPELFLQRILDMDDCRRMNGKG